MTAVDDLLERTRRLRGLPDTVEDEQVIESVAAIVRSAMPKPSHEVDIRWGAKFEARCTCGWSKDYERVEPLVSESGAVRMNELDHVVYVDHRNR